MKDEKRYRLVYASNPKADKYFNEDLLLEFVEINSKRYLNVWCYSFKNNIGFYTSEVLSVEEIEEGTVVITRNSKYIFQERED